MQRTTARAKFMNQHLPTTRRKSIAAVKSRRARQAFCEALEERQMMTLTIALQEANGATSAQVTTVGQVITLNVIAEITAGTAGSGDNNISTSDPNTFGIQDASGSVLSNAPFQHAVAGNLTFALNSNFTASGALHGTTQDLNGDGNIDVGSNDPANLNGASGAYILARAGSEFTTGTVVGSTKQIVLGTVTYTVTNLNSGGETDINFRVRPSNPGAYRAADWFDGVQYDAVSGQGFYASDSVSTFQTATPFVVTDPALVVAPTAVNDAATVVRNTPTTVSVLTNDQTVVAINKASLTIGAAPLHGTATPQTDGTVLYTPATGYLGADSFTYTIADTDNRVSNAATVSLNVVAPPPPVAGAVSASTIRNQAKDIVVLTSDTVTAPATLVPSSVTVVSAPASGTVLVQSDGSILYTPSNNFLGTDTFTYTVADSNAEVSTAGTVTVTVAAPVPPVAGNLTSTTSEGAPITLNLTAVDVFASAPVAPPLTIVTAPTHGTAVPQADGTILYTPAGGFIGNDAFTYTATDTLGSVSNIGTVTLTITTGVPPVANPVSAPVLVGQNNSINVLTSVTSGAPLVPSTVTVATQPTEGTASVDTATGLISYTPKAGFVGTDTFTYTVGNVNSDTSAPATVSVNVGTFISSAKGATHSLSFTDAASGLETVTLNSGTAQVFFSGSGTVTVARNGKATITGSALQISGIALAGTTRGSALSIKGSTKTPVTLGGITDASPLGSFTAPSAVLSGTVTLNSLGSLNVASITGANISIGAGLPGHFALTTGAVTNTSLHSAVLISSIRAASWTGDGATATANGIDFSPGGIVAPSLNSLTVTGAFSPDLTLTANGKARSLSSARITGAITGGTWTIPGPAGSITVGSIASAWIGHLGTLNAMTIKAGGLTSVFSAGTVGSLSIAGNVTGTLAVATAKLIRVNGAVSAASITATGLLNQLTVTGAITGSTIIADGNINTLSAASLTNSNVSAGIAGATTTLATATSANLGAATINSLRLTAKTGSDFANSSIVASKINSAALGTVSTSNGSIPEGIAVRTINSFSGVFAGNPLRAGKAQLTNDTVLAAYESQQGVTFGDFKILITG